MEQYIPKSALITEIEKVEDAPAPSHDQQCDWEDGYACGLCKAISIIDTIKVKEMDLESEIERIRKHYYINGDFEKAEINGRTITNIAKHFFELGMQVRNKAQKGERS